MTTKAKIGAGDVEIELDGETHVLRPTLRAARNISQQAGGFMAAIDAIGKFDLDAYIRVVTLGLGLSGSEARDIPDKVWRTGMPNLTDPIVRYLSILANGGRPVEERGGEEETDPQ